MLLPKSSPSLAESKWIDLDRAVATGLTAPLVNQPTLTPAEIEIVPLG